MNISEVIELVSELGDVEIVEEDHECARCSISPQAIYDIWTEWDRIEARISSQS